jgi:hypothetical protein
MIYLVSKAVQVAYAQDHMRKMCLELMQKRFAMMRSMEAGRYTDDSDASLMTSIGSSI